MKTWILARQLIDGTGGPPRERVAVAVADGRIVAVRSEKGFRRSRTDIVIDGGHAVLTPGLIDAHVHLTFSHGPTHDAIRAQVEGEQSAMLILRAARNAQMCLRAGITTVRDCGDRGLVTVALREAVNQGWLTAPRILASGTPITTTGGHLYWCGCEADSLAELRRAARRLCALGVDVIKVVATGGNMTSGTNPFQPQFTTGELQAVVNEAHRLGRRVAAHVLNTEGIRRTVESDVDTIEHCLWAAPDGSFSYDPSLAEELVARAVCVNITLAGVDRALLATKVDAPPKVAEKLACLRERTATAREMLTAGVSLLVSSDAGVRYTRFEDFALSLECAALGFQITPVEAIHRATLVPALALGLGEHVGSVEVGKQADLVLVEGDPVRNVSHMSRVLHVWRGGRLVVEGAMLRSPNEIHAVKPQAGQ